MSAQSLCIWLDTLKRAKRTKPYQYYLLVAPFEFPRARHSHPLVDSYISTQRPNLTVSDDFVRVTADCTYSYMFLFGRGDDDIHHRAAVDVNAYLDRCNLQPELWQKQSKVMKS